MITKSAFIAGFIMAMCVRAFADIFTDVPVFTLSDWVVYPVIIVGVIGSCLMVIKSLLIEKTLMSNIESFYRKIAEKQKTILRGTTQERN